MSEKATLADLGISKEELAVFVNGLIENNGGMEAEAMQLLYLKTATAAEILRMALGCEVAVVTLEDEE